MKRNKLGQWTWPFHAVEQIKLRKLVVESNMDSARVNKGASRHICIVPFDDKLLATCSDKATLLALKEKMDA